MADPLKLWGGDGGLWGGYGDIGGGGSWGSLWGDLGTPMGIWGPLVVMGTLGEGV